MGGAASGVAPPTLVTGDSIPLFTGGLGIVTIFSSLWIEIGLGFDSDQGHGVVERYVVLGLRVASALFFAISRAEVRLLASARSAA